VAILVGIMISVIGVALAYMISSLLNYPEMKGWAITELGEVLKTIFIIGLLGSAVVFIDIIIRAAFGFPATGGNILAPFYFTYARIYLVSLHHYFYNFFLVSLITLFYFGMFSGTGFYFLIYHVSPLAGFSFLLTFLQKYSLFSLSGILLIDFQQQLLTFFRVFSWRYLIPLGVVLRAFPITRKTGSTVIAFAVCGFFIYPLLLILNSMVLDNYVWGEPISAIVGPDYMLGDYSVYTENMMNQKMPSDDDINDAKNIINDLKTVSESSERPNTGGIGYDSYNNPPQPNHAKLLHDFEEILSTTPQGVGLVYAMDSISDVLKDFAGGIDVIKALVKVASFFFVPLFKVGLGNSMDAYIKTLLTSYTVYAEKFGLALLLFILDVMIFLTSMKDISLAIGGEEGLLGFGRMRRMFIKV